MSREPGVPRRLGVALVTLLGLGAALALPWLVGPPGLSPLSLQARVLTEDIYDVAERVSRVPVDVALPHMARAGLKPFLVGLPLEPATRDRLIARLDEDDFVDELVPFLIALKEMYAPAGAETVELFDAHLRGRYGASEALPGFEHSMFQWAAEPSEESDGESPGMDAELVAGLLSYYDALFLADRPTTTRAEERLACERGVDDLVATVDRARPALESLLERLRDRLEAGSDMESAVAGVLSDPSRLETIGISVVRFIDQLVCKHYRIFATRVQREEQLRAFLSGELLRPDGGRLWGWLDRAPERRHAVLIVVDGLQGHLIEALARGVPGDPFLAAIAEAQRRGAVGVAPEIPGEPAPPQQTEFLEHVAREGYRDPRYLPFFRSLYGAADPPHPGVAPWSVARSGLSTTPTISVRNLPVAFTGAPVAGAGSTGIPNFHFVDRGFRLDGAQQGRPYYFFGNDALELSRLASESGMRSLFERLADRSSYSCAAQYDEHAQAGIDPFFNLAIGEAVRDFGERLCFGDLTERAAVTRRLDAAREELLALRGKLGFTPSWWDWYRSWTRRAERRRAQQLVDDIARLETRALPELLIWYDPWPDHFAHFTGPFADEIVSPSGELARLDYWLGRLADLYAEGGVADRTLYGMAGDHGLSPVFRLVSPEALVLDALQEEGVPMTVVKISSDEGEGPKLTNPLRPPSMRGIDVVVASTAGGNLMLDLFVDQGERWDEQPLEADLRRWRPIAWLDGDPSRAVDLIHEVRERLGSSLDYLVVRAAPCGPDRASVRVMGPGGTASIERRGDRIYYHADPSPSRDTVDVLEISRINYWAPRSPSDRLVHWSAVALCVDRPDPDQAATWCTEEDWRRLLRQTPRPDSVVQLAHLYDLDRAGTVNLFPADGVGFNTIVPGRHAGESFHEKDAFAGLWGSPLGRGAEHGRLEVALGAAVPRAIYEYLRGGSSEGEAGWGAPSLWRWLHLETEPATPK